MAQPSAVGFYQSAFWRRLRQSCLDRDGWQCVVPGCSRRATHADHIVTRPPAPVPTAADVLTNLRSLCATHDAQVKEQNGKRKSGGAFRVRGADADGWPIDPARR